MGLDENERRGKKNWARTNRQEKRKSKTNKGKLNVIECEGIQISGQKHYEMIQRVSSGIPIPVKSAALV